MYRHKVLAVIVSAFMIFGMLSFIPSQQSQAVDGSTTPNPFKVRIYSKTDNSDACNAKKTPSQDLPQADFQGGVINATTAPKITGATGVPSKFVRAYICNYAVNIPITLSSATKTTFGDNNTSGVKFEFAAETGNIMSSAMPMQLAERYVIFEYIEDRTAQTISINYNKLKTAGISIVGPTSVEKENGKASAYFTVSVPRQYRPTATLASGTGTITKLEDISTPDKTVFSYKIEDMTTDVTININAQYKTRVSVTGKFEKSNALNGNGHVSNTTYTPSNGEKFTAGSDRRFVLFDAIDPSQKYSFDGNRAGELSANGYSYNGTANFQLYNDKVVYASYGAGMIFLTSIDINGQTFAAPQPYGRFGLHRKFLNPNANPNRPYYSYKYAPKDEDGGPWYAARTGQKTYDDPTVFTSFTADEGWDPYWKTDWQESGDTSYKVWYKTAFMPKVIGAKTVYEPKEGPMAGTKVTITILDAKPGTWNHTLGDDVDNLHYFMPGHGGKNWGYFNSMRIAYSVKVENLKDDIVVKDRWYYAIKSNVYNDLTVGMENVQVKASTVNNETFNSTGSDPGWKDILPKQFVDGAALPNSKPRNVKGDRRVYTDYPTAITAIENANPILYIRGDVVNGYKDPEFQDPAVSTQIQALSEPVKKPVPDSTNAPDHGVYGAYPMYAFGTSLTTTGNNAPWGSATNQNRNDSTFIFAGADIVGIHADLMEVPAWYKLPTGVTVTTPTSFPTKDEAKANDETKYNVSHNPIIHIPTEKPYKEGHPFLYWQLFPTKDGASIQNKEKKAISVKHFPGEDVDIRNEAEIGIRLSDKSGNVLVDGIELRPVFADDPDVNGLEYTVRKVLENKDKTIEYADPAKFVSTNAIYVAPSAEGIENYATPYFTYNNKRYKRSLSDTELENKYKQMFFFSNIYDINYVEVDQPDVIPITDPNMQRPDGYVKVTFDKGGHGYFQGTPITSYYVRKEAALNLSIFTNGYQPDPSVKLPTPVGHANYAHKYWTFDDNRQVEFNEAINKDMTITAQYLPVAYQLSKDNWDIKAKVPQLTNAEKTGLVYYLVTGDTEQKINAATGEGVQTPSASTALITGTVETDSTGQSWVRFNIPDNLRQKFNNKTFRIKAERNGYDTVSQPMTYDASIKVIFETNDADFANPTSADNPRKKTVNTVYGSTLSENDLATFVETSERILTSYELGGKEIDPTSTTFKEKETTITVRRIVLPNIVLPLTGAHGYLYYALGIILLLASIAFTGYYYKGIAKRFED